MVAARALAAALAVWAALLMPTGAAAESSSAMEKQELRQEGVRMLIAPNAPLNVQAVPTFNTMSLSLPLMSVTWDPPASGPSPLAYKVYVNDKLIDTVNAGSWTQSKLTNLVVGTRYKFSVAAVNADGESPPVDVYQVAVVMPDSVRNVLAVPGDGWIDVYCELGSTWPSTPVLCLYRLPLIDRIPMSIINRGRAAGRRRRTYQPIFH